MRQTSVKDYWETRLTTDFSFGGVGFLGVGEAYNRWLYKLRKSHFKKALELINANPHSNCLDIGSGTGFYLEQLVELGFTNIEGSDLTETSVNHLKNIYPKIKIYQSDITDNSISDRKYNLVTCMDVLFHIIEETPYKKAVNNLGCLVEKGGYLIFTENLTTSLKSRSHIFDRTREEIFQKIGEAGFEILDHWSEFILANPPVISSNKILWAISNYRVRLLKKIRNTPIKFWGNLFGATFYILDSLLFSLGVKGKGTSIIICRKL